MEVTIMAKWKRSFYLRWIEPLLEDNGAVSDGLKRWDVSFYCDTFYLLFRLVENPEVQQRGEDRRVEWGVRRSLLTLSLSLPSLGNPSVCVCVCLCPAPLSLFSVFSLNCMKAATRWAAPHLHLLSGLMKGSWHGCTGVWLLWCIYWHILMQ